MIEELLVIDDFLEPNFFAELQDLLLGGNFPWFYCDNVVNPNQDHFQFCHHFYYEDGYGTRSDLFNFLLPTLQKIDPYAIVRIKANLLTKTQNNIEHGFHTDVPYDKQNFVKTAILYINSNNGYTKFRDGSKIESVENRLLIFPSRLEHTGSTCTDEKTRVVINFNYYP